MKKASNEMMRNEGIEDLAVALCALERLAGDGGLVRVYIAMPDPERFALFGPPEEWMRATNARGRSLELPLRHVRLPRATVTLVGPPSSGLPGVPTTTIDSIAVSALPS